MKSQTEKIIRIKYNMVDYNGDNIMIEEMPQGCFIHEKTTPEVSNEFDSLPEIESTVRVSSVKDAKALIESLSRMIEIFEKDV